MNQLLEDLKAARELLVQKGWNQRHIARDAEGKRVDATDPSAVSYCMVGAVGCIAESTGSRPNQREMDMTRTLRNHMNSNFVISFNDTPGRTFDEVLEVFDKAINAVSGSKLLHGRT